MCARAEKFLIRSRMLFVLTCLNRMVRGESFRSALHRNNNLSKGKRVKEGEEEYNVRKTTIEITAIKTMATTAAETTICEESHSKARLLKA